MLNKKLNVKKLNTSTPYEYSKFKYLSQIVFLICKEHLRLNEFDVIFPATNGKNMGIYVETNVGGKRFFTERFLHFWLRRYVEYLRRDKFEKERIAIYKFE